MSVKAGSRGGHKTDTTATHLPVFAPRLGGMTKSAILLGAGPPLLVPLELKWDAVLDESELTSARSPEVMELPVREGETSLSMTQRSTTGSSDSWRRNRLWLHNLNLSQLLICSLISLLKLSYRMPHLNDLTVHLPAIFVVHVSDNASDSSAHFLNGADVSAVRRAWLWAGWSDWLPLKKKKVIQASTSVLPSHW